ncbi:MAG: MBL fold metallo-hydrolase [Acidimicrobiia bacterium]|nr:MBL fold metallo-hydrolase [Acidimicrobiia bacterium]
MTARIKALVVGPYDNQVYIVACEATSEAVIIDAADEPDRILEACTGLKVQSILTTHGHFDHIQAVTGVQERLDVPFRMHVADIPIAGREVDQPLQDGEEIKVGDLNLHVLHTPGHTPGSVCFVLDPSIFSGDTLFPGGPGATRWAYSSFGQIMDSIEQRLMTYPDSTLVYPGHGNETTIGSERPQLAAWRRRGW